MWLSLCPLSSVLARRTENPTEGVSHPSERIPAAQSVIIVAKLWLLLICSQFTCYLSPPVPVQFRPRTFAGDEAPHYPLHETSFYLYE